MKKENKKTALWRGMCTLMQIENLIYIVAVNGPEIQQEARLTLARFSRALAESKRSLVDAYSLTGLALRWSSISVRMSTLVVQCLLSALCFAAIALPVLGDSPRAAVSGALLALLAMTVSHYGRWIERWSCERLAENARDQLIEFDRMMRWLGFETANLSAMKHSLPEFRSWESLRAWAALRLEVCALSILIAKNPAAGPPLTDEERTLVVRRKEDDFFPFHRRLAACGLADQKVDGYFDRARAKIEKVPAESLVIG